MTTLSVRYAPTLLLVFLPFSSPYSHFLRLTLSVPPSTISFLFVFCYNNLLLSSLFMMSSPMSPLCSISHLDFYLELSMYVFNDFHTSPQRPSTTSYTWEYKPRNPYNHFQVSRAEMFPLPAAVSLPAFAHSPTVQPLLLQTSLS